MGKTLLELLKTFPFQDNLNPRNDGPGTIKPEPSNKNAVELTQVKKFVKNIPKIYGTDSVRILTQTDPHETKVAIKKTAGVVGSVFGNTGLGKLVNKGITSVADFNPKFPDDYLEGTDTYQSNSGLTFARYNDLYRSNYANGKYYNGGIKNSKSKLGSFLQNNKTPGQIKDAALGAAKTLIVGAAVAGALSLGKKLFKKKKQKEARGVDNPAKPTEKLPYPLFPSTFVMNSNPNDNDTVAYNQEQQMRNSSWPTRVANQGSVINIKKVSDLKDTASSINTDSKWAKLDEIYSNQIERFVRKNNDTDTKESYDVTSYYTSLTINNGAEDDYKRTGKYSKDILRIFKPSGTSALGSITPESWERYGSIKEFENNNPEWDNLIPTGSLYKFGTQNVSSLELGGLLNNTKNDLDNWMSYNAVSDIDYSKYWIKPVRWNGRENPYSKQTILGSPNKILDQDYYFASGSEQSQNNTKGRGYINPYINLKKDILNTKADTYDRIKFKIGDVILLGTLNGLSDNTTPNWIDVKAVGSGFKFFLYDSWEREISFKFRMYAESEYELQQIYDKAEKIKAYTLPKHNENLALGVFGELIKLDIGDLINESYGFLTQANLTVIDESPWEITDGLQKPFVYDMDISYKVVTNKTNYNHYTKNKVNKKAFDIKTKPETATTVAIPGPPSLGTTVPIEDIPVEMNTATTKIADLPYNSQRGYGLGQYGGEL